MTFRNTEVRSSFDPTRIGPCLQPTRMASSQTRGFRRIFLLKFFFGNFEKFLEISTEPEFVAEPTMTQLKSEVFVDFSQKF